MQIALHNSKLTLLLPKSYERVGNGASLYPEMYQKRKAEDVEMFQSLSSSSYGNIVIAHINLADSMRFGDKALLISRYILCYEQFNTKLESITWEECSLRSRLNNEFLNDI